MKTITYIGDPANGGEGPEETKFQGVAMTKGVAFKCESDAVISKAMGNSHYEVGEAKKAKKGA